MNCSPNSARSCSSWKKPCPKKFHETAHRFSSEAISRMRDGRVIRRPGFDGQYGTIRLFTDEELK